MLLALLLVYVAYFLLLTFRAISHLRYQLLSMPYFDVSTLKKSYRFVLYATFGVIFVSVLLMLVEGVPGYTNSSADALLLVAQLGLFNIYLYMIAYLYAPAADGGGSTHYEQQESQDDKIIKYAARF